MTRALGTNAAPPRGIALIIAVGVLAVLAALGVGFYTLMASQTHRAVRNSDQVRAEMMARAGLNEAIARLRQEILQRPESSNDGWYSYDKDGKRRSAYEATDDSGKPLGYTRALGSNAGPASDRYSLHISDPASKINVNASDNLGVLLDNLCRVIGAPLVAAEQGDGHAIAAYRAKYGRFSFIDDIKPALTGAEQDRDAKFAALREYITVDSPTGPAGKESAPVNVNTAASEVLTAVLLHYGAYWEKLSLSMDDARAWSAAIVQARAKAPLNSWAEVAALAENTLPLGSTGGSGMKELAYNSGGVFTIESTGKVARRTEILAESKMAAVVQIYDVWREKVSGASSPYLSRDLYGAVKNQKAVDGVESVTPLRLSWTVSTNSVAKPANSFQIDALQGTEALAVRANASAGVGYAELQPIGVPADQLRLRAALRKDAGETLEQISLIYLSRPRYLSCRELP